MTKIHFLAPNFYQIYLLLFVFKLKIARSQNKYPIASRKMSSFVSAVGMVWHLQFENDDIWNVFNNNICTLRLFGWEPVSRLTQKIPKYNTIQVGALFQGYKPTLFCLT